MTASLESAQQSKMDTVISTWKLTVTDRRLMWLQKQHPGTCGHKLQLWAGIRSLQGTFVPHQSQTCRIRGQP
jgi:hypothetical protein